jgi:hypothetical protein
MASYDDDQAFYKRFCQMMKRYQAEQGAAGSVQDNTISNLPRKVKTTLPGGAELRPPAGDRMIPQAAPVKVLDRMPKSGTKPLVLREEGLPFPYSRDDSTGDVEMDRRVRRAKRARELQVADNYSKDYLHYLREVEQAEVAVRAPAPTPRQLELARALQRRDSYRREWADYVRTASAIA